MTDDRPVKEMSVFFDSVASTYEAHMREAITDFDAFYGSAVGLIPVTSAAISVLDLGCGTGLELAPLFEKAPNAVVTGVDVSGEMLRILEGRYRERVRQLHLIQGSYEEVELPEGAFDFCVSVMSLHHFVYAQKRAVYERIRRFLKPGGLYIEADWYVTHDEEREYMARYLQTEEARGGRLCHVDIPFSLPVQLRVMEDSGFRPVEVFWRQDPRAVIAARKGRGGREGGDSRRMGEGMRVGLAE